MNHNHNLMLGLKNSSDSLVLHALKNGADPNHQDHDGYLPLMIACASPQYIRLLLQYGANINESAGASEHAPLSYAAIKGTAFTVALMLMHGADVHHADKDGWTPLHWAMFHRVAVPHPARVRVLLEAGANPNAMNLINETPQDLADRLEFKGFTIADVQEEIAIRQANRIMKELADAPVKSMKRRM
ncbi:ankyrin repeat domain-containing protein [Pseudoxanthomonas winnipegensis]|uniref:Ankyrin repeat domain-containing protein n=1 Tax=Pseudoxanthomonas winnipegensis TaxID=2480810 RepID=A0A4Q8M496_9GAMM|nr:ankyrin repeat domain-containing protein [Pseudoxanthomonas winnipegensis]TAA41580.1 ankyrin repeat domain-containing protein [Pseudoxanthomonas winnipegensis]